MIAFGTIAIIVVLVLSARAMRPKDAILGPSGAANEIPTVSVISPGISTVTSTVTFTGAIYARYDMPIGADADAGRITEVLVEAGDRVKRGQVLARLDNTVLLPQVARLRASLAEAKANAALALAQYNRAKGVEAAGALSAEEIERRRAAYVTADAQVNVAAAALAEAEARLAHSQMRSPVDGVVLTRSAEVGQMGVPGSATPLFRVAEGGEVEMRGQVAEQDLPALKIGQKARVHLTGAAKPFEGKVRLLGAVIDPQTRLGEIRIALQPDPSLRPGAFARAEVAVGDQSRTVLPQSAVLADAAGSYVYIVNSKNRIERTPVLVSTTTSRGVIIGSGLTGSEQIVMTAGGFLREGEQVRPSKVNPALEAQGS
jgi:RND family efflux transporter MFP subunit